jgi:hypothetical protein
MPETPPSVIPVHAAPAKQPSMTPPQRNRAPLAAAHSRCYAVRMANPATISGTGVVLRPGEFIGWIVEGGILAAGAALAVALVLWTAPNAWQPAAFAALAAIAAGLGWAIRRANRRTLAALERLRSGTGLAVSCARATFGLLDYPEARGVCGAVVIEATTTGAPGQTAGSTIITFRRADGRSLPASAVAGLFEARGLTVRPAGGGEGLHIGALLSDARVVDALIDLARRP